jgi:hypothetical protein
MDGSNAVDKYQYTIFIRNCKTNLDENQKYFRHFLLRFLINIVKYRMNANEIFFTFREKTSLEATFCALR